jgi:hypothetical protein
LEVDVNKKRSKPSRADAVHHLGELKVVVGQKEGGDSSGEGDVVEDGGRDWGVQASSMSIPEHFELGTARPTPGPPMNLTGQAWAEILKPKIFFGPSPARNAIFSCFTL